MWAWALLGLGREPRGGEKGSWPGKMMYSSDPSPGSQRQAMEIYGKLSSASLSLYRQLRYLC